MSKVKVTRRHARRFFSIVRKIPARSGSGPGKAEEPDRSIHKDPLPVPGCRDPGIELPTNRGVIGDFFELRMRPVAAPYETLEAIGIAQQRQGRECDGMAPVPVTVSTGKFHPDPAGLAAGQEIPETGVLDTQGGVRPA